MAHVETVTRTTRSTPVHSARGADNRAIYPLKRSRAALPTPEATKADQLIEHLNDKSPRPVHVAWLAAPGHDSKCRSAWQHTRVTRVWAHQRAPATHAVESWLIAGGARRVLSPVDTSRSNASQVRPFSGPAGRSLAALRSPVRWKLAVWISETGKSHNS